MGLASKAEQTKWRMFLIFFSTYSHWITGYLSLRSNTLSLGQFESWWSRGARDNAGQEIRTVSFKRYDL